MKIAAIQKILHWHDPQANFKSFESEIELLAEDVDLVVLPEMFSTGFTMNPEDLDVNVGAITLQWMQRMAANFQIALLGSTAFFDGRIWSNRAFIVHADGSHNHYNKRHGFSMSNEEKIYQNGEERIQEKVKDLMICPMICYDLRFPVWSRNKKPYYDLLIYMANWPIYRISAWNDLLKARAIENMCYVIGVNRTGSDKNGWEYNGCSAVYDPLGVELAFLNEDESSCVVELDKAHLNQIRNELGFLKDADSFEINL